MAKVTLENVVKTYPEKSGPGVRAVDGVSFAVADREFMVLVGPSGCGKSTTLRMIAGLEDISAGTIAIDGQVINAVAPKDRDIAMVFQNYALYPHMSVYDNMAFGLKMRKFPKAEIDARVREAAALLSLESYLERKPKTLSGGQRQRVALGRAIVRKPKVFLFDEPLSNLDAKMRVAMRRELSKLHARLGATMIYVTHDQVEAMTMGDRICLMKDGRIMQIDAPLNLYHHPRNLFVAGFIGTPPMNFFRGALKGVGDSLVFAESGQGREGVSFNLPASLSRRVAGGIGRPLVLGIRPEKVSPAGPGQTGVEVRVELFEPMGAEAYLHATTGLTSFVARVPLAGSFAVGLSVRVGFDLEQACIFDAATEEVLG
jgi:multiple sugar transport system ATP-binding protein